MPTATPSGDLVTETDKEVVAYDLRRVEFKGRTRAEF